MWGVKTARFNDGVRCNWNCGVAVHYRATSTKHTARRGGHHLSESGLTRKYQ